MWPPQTAFVPKNVREKFYNLVGRVAVISDPLQLAHGELGHDQRDGIISRAAATGLLACILIVER